jgi:hypothetical protein
LIEEARTNSLLQSEDLATSWAPSTVTIGANDTTAPDGTTTADDVRAASTSATMAHTQNLSITASQTHAFSCWFKENEVRYIQVRIDGASANGVYCNIDLQLGTFRVSGTAFGTGTTAVSSELVEYPDGWYRLKLVGTLAGETTGRVFAQMLDDTDKDAAPTPVCSASVGDGFWMWGAQWEKNVQFCSSYIPTTTAAVTRAVDNVTADITDLLNTEEYSMYLHLIAPSQSASGQGAVLFADTNDYSRITFTGTDIDSNILDNGSAQVAETIESSYSKGADSRSAISVKLNDYAAVANGGTVVTDTAVTLPDAPITLQLLSWIGAEQFINTHIKHIALFNVALSDADIQTITTG